MCVCVCVCVTLLIGRATDRSSVGFTRYRNLHVVHFEKHSVFVLVVPVVK